MDGGGAQRLLARAELNFKMEGRRADPNVPVEHVLGQEPLAGGRLKKGRSVKVWVSLGPPRRTVPRVEGESLRSAQLILEQSGFSLLKISEVASRHYSADTVIAQSPAPYSEVGEVAEVSVLVSRGHRGDFFVMPDCIGKEIADVIDRVRASNLRISNIWYQEYPGVSKGLVVRQTPLAGSKVRPQDAIVLYVSKGA
jgi:serine/threonine-protein kinase